MLAGRMNGTNVTEGTLFAAALLLAGLGAGRRPARRGTR
jgi:hypothetical protein